MRRNMTQQTASGILDDLEAGMTQADAAAKWGVSPMAVSNLVTRQHNRKLYEAWEADRSGESEAELERMIAEQLPTMPREPHLERRSHVPHAVARGRGRSFCDWNKAPS